MPGWGQIQWGASSCSAFQDDGGQVFRRSFISSRVVGAACVYREHVLSLQRLVADNVGLKYLEERQPWQILCGGKLGGLYVEGLATRNGKGFE